MPGGSRNCDSRRANGRGLKIGFRSSEQGGLVSEVQVRQIEKYLEKLYAGLVDLSDCATASPESRDEHFLTRSLAAFSISQTAMIEPSVAATSIVDGADDNGIDAVFHDSSTKRLFVCQSKWIKSGSGTISLGDLEKYLTGLKDLVSANFSKFNAKLQAKAAEIQTALYDSKTTIVLVIAYTGSQDLDEKHKARVQETLDAYNDTSDLMSARTLNQKVLHKAVAGYQEGDPINAELTLFQWGFIDEPYESFYGQIEASDVAQLHEEFGQRLFAKNIRKILGSTSVNQSIQQTLLADPENFWYYNNGITVLCSAVKKAPVGGIRRESAVLSCEGMSIVNGAQTVGSIADAAAADPEKVKDARVMIRIISLENCPADFEINVTKATNTQNRVELRDFAALDPEQDRLRLELALEDVHYLIKRGEAAPPDEPSLTFEEAAVALACAHGSQSFAVHAKREVSKLWENIETSPYKALFNPGLSATRLWNCVQAARAMEKRLEERRRTAESREQLIIVHGNRLIQHLMFKKLDPSSLEAAGAIGSLLEAIEKEIDPVIDSVLHHVKARGEGFYPGSFFKNFERCAELARLISTPVSTTASSTLDVFPPSDDTT